MISVRAAGSIVWLRLGWPSSVCSGRFIWRSPFAVRRLAFGVWRLAFGVLPVTSVICAFRLIVSRGAEFSDRTFCPEGPARIATEAFGGDLMNVARQFTAWTRLKRAFRPVRVRCDRRPSGYLRPCSVFVSRVNEMSHYQNHRNHCNDLATLRSSVVRRPLRDGAGLSRDPGP